MIRMIDKSSNLGEIFAVGEIIMTDGNDLSDFIGIIFTFHVIIL